MVHGVPSPSSRRNEEGARRRSARFPVVFLAIFVCLAVLAAASDIIVNDTTFPEAVQYTFIVPWGANVSLSGPSTFAIAEDAGVFGNITVDGTFELSAGDDIAVWGALIATNGDVRLFAEGDIVVDGSITSVAGANITLESGGNLSIHGDVTGSLGTGMGLNGTSIQLVAGADITVTGRVLAGPGQAGASSHTSSSAIGSHGGSGGGIVIQAGGLVTIANGTLAPGFGAPGGNAIGTAAAGGQGGDGGRITISGQTMDFEGAHLLPSAGGAGGAAVAIGSSSASAEGGDGGKAMAVTLIRSNLTTNLSAGAWGLTWNASGLQITDYGVVSYGISAVANQEGSVPILRAPHLQIPTATLTTPASFPSGPLSPSTCLAMAAIGPPRASTSWSEGGPGGIGCVEGIPGVVGTKGADGIDSLSILDSCTDGAGGQTPQQAGTAGTAYGGHGGFAEAGISGLGGHALSLGGRGGLGGDGGKGGAGYDLQDGCNGGGAAHGGNGGPGGSAFGGSGGPAGCGYPGRAGGASSRGGHGGAPGVPGEAGDGGASGSPGNPGNDAKVGTTGAFTNGSSGNASSPTFSGCRTFTPGEIHGGNVVIDVQNDGPNAVLPRLGHPSFQVPISGAEIVDMMDYNGTTIARRSLHGVEVDLRLDVDYLLDRSTTYASPLFALNETDIVTTTSGTFWMIDQAIEEENWWDWLNHTSPPPAEASYTFISDMWTKAVTCGNSGNMATNSSTLVAFAITNLAESPCGDGETVNWVKKLPLTNEYQDSQTTVATSVVAAYINEGWESGCSGQERWISYKLSHDGEIVWRPQDASIFLDLSWEPCGDQHHMRLYYVTASQAFGQAHLEHFHYQQCGGIYHCLHGIESSSFLAADDLPSSGQWGFYVNNFCANSLMGEWHIHADSSLGTYSSDGCLHFNYRV